MKRLWWIVLLLLTLVIGFSPATAQGDNIIHIVSNFDIRTIDPQIAYETETWSSVGLFFRGLVALETADTIAPALAESYTVSDDGLVYTFKMREGGKFGNGRDITAEDVKYTFQRELDPNFASPTSFFYEGIVGVPEYRAGTADEISGIKIIDPMTVEISLQYPVWTFLTRLALPPGAIIPKEDVEAANGDFGHHPSGAGPFNFVSWEPGVRITAERNPYYYKAGLPVADGVTIDLLVEQSVGILRMDSGDADVAFDWVPSSEYPRIAADPALSARLLESVAFPNIDYVVYQHAHPPFDNIAVRQALSMAINRDRLVQLLNGRAVVAGGLFPPAMPGNNADLQAPAYDPDGARQMLADAGFDGSVPIEFVSNTDATNQQISQAIISDWQAVGVNSNLTVIDNAQFLDILLNQHDTWDAAMTNWYSDYLDPSDNYEPLLKCGGSYNWGEYCNEALDTTYAAANAIAPGDDRNAAFSAFEADLSADYPNAFLYHLSNFYYHSERLTIASDPSYLLRFDEATVQ